MSGDSVPIPEAVHLPRRPGWDCLSCREPWPCAPAKVTMAEEYVDDQLSLALSLSLQMIDAIDDLASTGAPIPGDLYDRFLGWFGVLRADSGTPDGMDILSWMHHDPGL